MITPKFTCSQTASHVQVEIHISAIRASEVEIHVDGTLFSLHVNPYFLRLTFPGLVEEDDESSAIYDPSSGTLLVKLTKKNHGEVFPNLDLLSKLLAPIPSRSDFPVIEVLEGNDGGQDDEDIAQLTSQLEISSSEFQEAIEYDWQLPQNPPSHHENDNIISATQPYGFLDLHSGFLTHVHLTENEVNELGERAECSTPSERSTAREVSESSKFDGEYYMADFVDSETILELIAWHNPYHSPEWVELKEPDNSVLLRLPNKEYLISEAWSRSLYLTLISILFSFSYETRSTLHEPTPESAWTVSVLTPAFTALDVSASSSVCHTLRASYRRALAFPLYRSWRLCERCQLDVAEILSGGVRSVLKCLLETKTILDHHDIYYIYSKIWIDDYCVWIQRHAKSEILAELGRQIRNFKINKRSIGWDLEELEVLAQEERETDSDDESEKEVETMTASQV